MTTLIKQSNKIQELFSFDDANKKENDFDFIIGTDEAGRGPLAGPVVAGAVILPKDCRILYINDSKKLSEKRRNELFDIIKEERIK